MEMKFCYSKRSVACALSMIVLLTAAALGHTVPDLSVETTPASSLETTPNSSVEHVEKPVEKPFAISEDLVGYYNNPSIRVGCRVIEAAYGLDDWKRYGFVSTSQSRQIDILVPGDPCRNRGVTLFELDPTTCTMRNRQTFDTFGSSIDRMQLLETLETAAAGTIIFGVTADSAEGDYQVFQNSAGSFFLKYNMDLSGLEIRDKFAFILQKGYPKKTVWERRARSLESIWMVVELFGSTVSDVTLRRV